MLSTQVEYWKLQENVRHNVETEQQGWFNARETQRHNVETESVNWFNANENQRHNYRTEDISWFNAQENQRHNLATEELGFSNLAETARHNVAEEGIGTISANAAMLRAQANWKDAQTKADQVKLNTAELNWQNYFNEQNLELNQRRADIAQQEADTRFRQVDESIAQGWLGLSNTAYSNILTANRLEHQTAIDWANFGLNTGSAVSREARGWISLVTE